MFGAAAVPRTAGALACLALAATASAVPQVVTAVLVVLVLGAVNGVEAFIVETGRPLLLLRMPGRRRAAN